MLDVRLGGGWPTGMLTEVLVARQGSGELGLLSPALARLTTAGMATTDTATPASGWVALIAPPWLPYAPGLCWQGLALDRMLTVGVRQPREILWAMAEVLRSGACAGVIAWAGTTAGQRVGHSLLQQLHLLAGRQQAWAVLIRAAQVRRQPSPARLRLQILSPMPGALQVEIFKNGWRGTGAVIVEQHF